VKKGRSWRGGGRSRGGGKEEKKLVIRGVTRPNPKGRGGSGRGEGESRLSLEEKADKAK